MTQKNQILRCVQDDYLGIFNNLILEIAIFLCPSETFRGSVVS